MNPQFSHLTARGDARMVDVGAKPAQKRRATASGRLRCAPETLAALRANALPKGDVLAVARVAGIQAAKLTPALIPLCHQLPLEQVTVDFQTHAEFIEITCSVATTSKTGVEMEALAGVSVAALTLYDMMKSADKQMVICDIRVLEKRKE